MLRLMEMQKHLEKEDLVLKEESILEVKEKEKEKEKDLNQNHLLPPQKKERKKEKKIQK